ncbi:hypothetical protein [Aeromonas phage phiWae14]|nr:hypothetical protein [Aeromonas phage phiWae14]
MLTIIEQIEHIISFKNGNEDHMVVVTKSNNYHEISHYHNQEFGATCWTVCDEIGVGIESFDKSDIVKYIKGME